MEKPERNAPIPVWEALGMEDFALLGLAATPASNALSPDNEFQAACQKLRGMQAIAREDPSEMNLAYRDDAERDLSRLVCTRLHSRQRSALCFSGGGIRSATFSLGVLQGLAKHSFDRAEQDKFCLLTEFDYLSTVSGGGFVGSWFSSWIHREEDRGGIRSVIRQLAEPQKDKLEPEPPPLYHLRSYSNYLNPRLGVTSADTWTLGATVVRNIFLNWLVLLPLLAAVLCIPRVVIALLAFAPEPHDPSRKPLLMALAIVSLLAGAMAVFYAFSDLPSGGDRKWHQARFLRSCLLPLLVSATCFAWFRAWIHPVAVKVYVLLSIGVLLISAVIALISAARKRRLRIDWIWLVKAISALVLLGALGGFALAVVDRHTPDINTPYVQRLYAWLALPAIFLLLFLLLGLLVGLTSRITNDEDREWWARAGAWTLIVACGWFVFSGIVLFAPAGFLLIKASLATALGAVTSRLGFSPKTPANSQGAAASEVLSAARSRDVLLGLTLVLFLLFGAITLASLNQLVMQKIMGAVHSQVDQADLQCNQLDSYWKRIRCQMRGLAEAKPGTPGAELFLFVTAFAIAGLASLAVNVNKFSLHGMYRSRLIRAYLGASRPAGQRNPNLFTGFDPDDNLSMSKLRHRPLHVVNMALNLVGGEKLAWQERKAASFSASPLYTGSCWLGYRPTSSYSNNDKDEKGESIGLTLGGAITISGAAASPNMGYHSSPLLTVVMTLFNARLGAWLGNPGHAGTNSWFKNGPTSGLRAFVDEMLGLTNKDNPWVYLSDGGHFENLGLYEMVLRRCHNIVVVDASADPLFEFENLGNALRKIRVDMAIPIEFQDGNSLPMTLRKSKQSHAVGYIRYSAVDPVSRDDDGVLLYIKPSISGNEPIDVIQYGRKNEEFPQQPTADQWFDESQFESYRELGEYTIHRLCGSPRGRICLAQLVQAAQARKSSVAFRKLWRDVKSYL
jgi:hypothetical protein